MLRNYIIQFFRNVKRRKLFSFINITGLGFGIAFILLIGQYLYHEFNCNKEIKDVGKIYRLVDAENSDYNIDYRISDKILESIPGVNNACVINHFGVDANYKDKNFTISDGLIVSSNFFNIFNVQFIYGNSKEALHSIDDVVLTESEAIKIFGTRNVVGKTIQLNHQIDFIVTGVIKDLPENISFKSNAFISYLNSPKERISYKQNGSIYPFNIFVKLNKNSNIKLVENKISELSKVDSLLFPKKIILTPLKTNYLNSDFHDSDLMHVNSGLIKLLSFIGIIILLLAIINFINLETAAYKYRLKEMGIKKCLGAERKNLIHQLLIESTFTTIISGILGVILAEIFLPYFNQFIDKSLSLQVFCNLSFLSLFITFILLLSLIAGLIPAIILSKISPLNLFKVNPHSITFGTSSRGFLTMFQFAVTIILICELIIINKQIDFVKHKGLGFKTDKLIYVAAPYTLGNRLTPLVNKLQQYHGMKSITRTMGIPGSIYLILNGYKTIEIDSTSLKTFGFRIIQGRNLLPGDEGKVCYVNEEAFKKLKVNKLKNQKILGDLVGVVADFNYESLYNATGPLVLWYSKQFEYTHITMRISGPIDEAISYIKKTWDEVCPDYPINLGFYDEYFASMYKKEENLATLVSIFSILAIVISCLGIFGLSVFQSEQRIKEIGNRKVLGASITEVMMLLIKNFSKWVIFANVIAIPAAYYFMQKWLQDFAYRIEISWWILRWQDSLH